MKTFLVAALGSLVAVSANKCSHTTCKMVEQNTPLGRHAVMMITHSNIENQCSRFETTSTNPHTVTTSAAQVHCSRVKRWEQNTDQVANGKWVYDGQCECHVKGSHPNGDGGLQQFTSLVATDTFDFNDKGTTNNLINTKAVYEKDDFKVTLAGFTHTRPYARGYLRNTNGEATATVSNLEPGKAYHFKVFQFDSSGLSWNHPLNGAAKGANGFSVNGVAQADTITLQSSDAPTTTGQATASADGTIVFGFTRKQHHVDLSGIEITGARVADPTSFKAEGDKGGLASKTTEYTLEGGYVAKLAGWTHTRTYAGGFLRNKAGDGTATVSGLRPGAQYKYHVHQFDSSGLSWNRPLNGAAKGANGFSVNGVAQPDTITLKSSNAPTASGLATANADGTIEFAFTRQQHHVDLSGLSVHLAVDAVAPFEEAPGAANCASGQIIDTVDECRLAAQHVGRPFAKAVRDATSRPAGCFWDQNGSAYFNQELGASATWGGVGGLCKKEIPEHIAVGHVTEHAETTHGPRTVHKDCGYTAGGCGKTFVIAHTCKASNGACACTCKKPTALQRRDHHVITQLPNKFDLVNNTPKNVPHTAWPKISNKHCAGTKADSKTYLTRAAAAAACRLNSKCSGIYDPSCDAKGSWYTCTKNAYASSGMGSCIFKMPPTNVAPTPAPAPKPYMLQVSGKCASPITTAEDCATAAKVLGLSDKTVTDDGQHGGVSYDPKGCYFEQGSLKYNKYHKNTGTCNSIDNCLCRVPMVSTKMVGEEGRPVIKK